MGGSGSGWQYGRKTQVEECLILAASRLQRLGLLRPNLKSTSRLSWRDGYGDDIGGGTWELGVQTSEEEGKVYLQRPGQSWWSHSANLTTTVLPWGALRWWFLCPMRGRHGNGCFQRVGKLYLPPGGDTFGCRHCHKLTYWTCQNSDHRWDR